MPDYTKRLDVKNLAQLQDYAHRRYFVRLKPGDTYADLFVPTFWSYHRGKLDAHDLIRVQAHDPDNGFDVVVTVKEVRTDGVVMQRWPVEPSAEEAAEALEIGKSKRVVPFGPDGRPAVRIEYLPATNWRVIGLHSEVSAGHETEALARKAMDEYLAGIHYVMPSAQEAAAELARHAERMAAEAEKAQAKRAAARK